MGEPYHILIIEDDPEHAELMKGAFRKHDEFFLDFASSGEEGLDMIKSASYDLVSVDLILPGMGGLDVLIRIRRFDQDIPVVMVSGHGTTEMAVIAFENRATKYVVKSMESFKSLPYIFENLIQESKFRIQERSMRDQIERSERIHRNVVENALAGIYILQDGIFKLVNPKLGEIFGCQQEELLGCPFWHLIQPDNLQLVSKLEVDCEREGPAPAYEARILRKDGENRWIEFRTVPIEYEGRRAILGNLVDITLRKESELILVRSKMQLEAINSLTTRMLNPSGDLEKELAGALADLLTGVEDGEIGGIFLMEKAGLILRSLVGSVEPLISFMEGLDASSLLAAPKVYNREEAFNRLWASAPLACRGRTIGVAIIASLAEDGSSCIAYLKQASPYLGHMLEAYDLESPIDDLSSDEPLLHQMERGRVRE